MIPKIQIKNYSMIAISNIAQQLISIVSTMLLVKTFGSSEYSIYVFFISLTNSIIFFSNSWINPFFMREGSFEFDKTGEISESLKILLNFILIINIVLLIIITSIELNFENNAIKYLVIFFSMSNIIFVILKTFYRISDKIKSYCLLVLSEKGFFLIAVLIIIFFFRTTNMNLFLYLITFFSTTFSLILLIKLIKLNKINFKLKKDLLLSYLKHSGIIFIASIVVYFTTFDFLIIFTSLELQNKEIIGYLNIGLLITNLLYMPVFWIEQIFNPKINILVIKNNKKLIKKYFSDVVIALLSLSMIIELITIVIIKETNLLGILLNDDFKNNNFYILLMIFITVYRSYDTLLSIPLFAKKKEVFFLGFNIIKLALFLLFLTIFKNNTLLILLSFVSLSFVQSIAYSIFTKITFSYANIYLLILFGILNFILLFVFFFDFYFYWFLTPCLIISLVIFILKFISSKFILSLKDEINNLSNKNLLIK